MGERISRGFYLLGASWRVLRSDKELILLPLIAMGATALVAMTLAGVGWVSGLFAAEVAPSEQYARFLLLGIFYFVAYTISIFFNAAMIGAAMVRLEGGDPTLGDGIRKAWERFDRILAWAAIAATVGLVLHVLQERGGALGNIVGKIAGVAWSAVTFFVVPVLLYEPAGVGKAMKRSASIFRQRWGEQFVGNGAIAIAMFLLTLSVVAVLVPIAVVVPPVGITMLLFAICALVAVGSATTAIFNAALYRYATTGAVVGPFAEGDLASAFKPGKRGRRRGLLGGSATGINALQPGTTLEQYVRGSGLPASVEEAKERERTGEQPPLPGLEP